MQQLSKLVLCTHTPVVEAALAASLSGLALAAAVHQRKMHHRQQNTSVNAVLH
jgi:hypothetical protein